MDFRNSKIFGNSKLINGPQVLGTKTEYSIYVDIAFTDNKNPLYGQQATFCGSGEWESADTYIEIPEVPEDRTAETLNVHLMYRNDNVQGYALFDNVGIAVFAPYDLSLTDKNAFDGSNLSRTGHHNDCFLASVSDQGTYTSDKIDEEKKYLESETKYTTMGGETCIYNPPRSDCVTALVELKQFHYTYLNSGFEEKVLNEWKAQGCYNEIAARLGYRLVINSGTYGTRAPPGGIVPYSVEFDNVGYAAPVNEHSIQLVMVEQGTNDKCTGIMKNTDVRTWYGGMTHEVKGDLKLPDDIQLGTYDLFLTLADNDLGLQLSSSEYTVSGTRNVM